MRNKIIIPFFAVASLIIITFLLFGDMESFFSDLLQKAGNNAKTYILVSFIALASDIVLPVPSSIIMFTNGYILGTFYGAVLSLTSVMVGAVIGYYLGRFTALGFKSKKDSRVNEVMSKYGALSVLITRGIPIISESICIVCGYNKMPFKKYFLYNLIGYIPLCFLYSFCGSIGYEKNIFLLSFGCSIIISAAFWFFGKMFFLRFKNGS